MDTIVGLLSAAPPVTEGGGGDKIRAVLLARRNVATTPQEHTGRGRATTATPEGLSYSMDGDDIRFDEPPR